MKKFLKHYIEKAEGVEGVEVSSWETKGDQCIVQWSINGEKQVPLMVRVWDAIGMIYDGSVGGAHPV